MANSDGGATSVAIDVPVEIELRNGAVGSSSAQTSPVSTSAYMEELAAGAREPFEDFDESGFLSVSGQDLEGRQLVVIVGKHLPASSTSRDRLRKYFIQKLHPVVLKGSYSILFVNTEATFKENSPGVLWLRSTVESLPSMYRAQLGAIYCLHPTLGLRLLLWAVVPWMSEGLWQKLVYISRLEFLSDYVKPDALEFPEFVLEHDRELEGRPLMDYGVEADSDQAAMLRSATETVPELREPLGVYHGAG